MCGSSDWTVVPHFYLNINPVILHFYVNLKRWQNIFPYKCSYRSKGNDESLKTPSLIYLFWLSLVIEVIWKLQVSYTFYLNINPVILHFYVNLKRWQNIFPYKCSYRCKSNDESLKTPSLIYLVWLSLIIEVIWKLQVSYTLLDFRW